MTLAYLSSQGTVLVSSGGTFSHAAGGSPKAVMVFCVASAPGGDVVSGATYGGTAMTEIPSAGGHIYKSTGETCGVWAFFLGASVPTGTQNVAITGSGSISVSVCVITWTAASDCEVVDSDASISSNSQINPSATLSLGGRSCAVAIGFFSGTGTVGSISPLTGWTSRAERDFGAQTAGYYTYDTIGTSDVTMGWTQGADDAACIGMAIAEISTVTPRNFGIVIGG